MSYGNIKHKSYGLNWYYTAAKTLYGNQPEGHIIIAQQSKKMGHTFSHTTPDNLIKLIDKNRGLYEVLTDYPKKVYADIDFHDPSPDFDQEEYFATTIKQFRQFLPDIEFAISGSLSETRASFHFVSTNYLIENDEQLQVLKTIAKALLQENEGIDWKVYTKNREMKCINQSKPDKPVQKPITHTDDLTAHIISSFFPTNYQSVPSILDIKEEDPVVKLQKVKNILVDDIPTLDLPNPTDITWEQLALPEHAIDLLSLIPNGPEFPHSHTYTIANYCVTNKVPKAYFLKWLAKKGGSAEDIRQRQNKYKNVHLPALEKHNQFPISQYSMRKRLLRWYPNLRPTERAFNQFKEQMEVDKVIVNDLDKETFSTYQSKFLTLNYPMGFGKTTHLLDYLSGYLNPSFVYIVPRITLAEDIYTRMTAANIDVHLYKNVGRYKEEKARLLADSEKTPNLIICLNSLHYLNDRDMLFRRVIFDECETSMSAFIGSGADKYGNVFMTPEAKQQNLIALKSIVKYADQVIGLDAFTTKRWTNLCQSVCPKEKHTILDADTPQEYTRKLIQLKGKKYENVLKMIADDITRGEKVFAFFPYKNGTKKVAGMESVLETIAYLVRQKGIQFERGEDYQCYNADTDDKVKREIGDVNEWWDKYKLVMCNNSITAGVSYIANNKFSKVYLFVAPFNLPRDIAQVSMRCRQLVTNEVYIQFIDGATPEAYYDDTKEVNVSFYTQLHNDSMTEFFSPLKQTCELFFSKANFDVSASARSTKKAQEVADILEDIEQQISQIEFDALPDLVDEDAQELMRHHLVYQNARTSERYALRKWMFRRQFNDDTPTDVLKTIWDAGFYRAVTEAKKAQDEPQSFENLLAKANNWDFFPVVDGEPKRARDVKWTMPDEAREAIFDQWKSRFTKDTKQIPDLLKAVFNTKYGMPLIIAEREKTGKKAVNLVYSTDAETADAVRCFAQYVKKEVEDGVVE